MQQFFEGIMTRLRTEFQAEAMGAWLATFAANLVVGVLTFAAIYTFWRLLDLALGFALKRYEVDRTTGSFMTTALKYLLLTLATVQTLSAFGINTAALVAR